MPQSNKVRINEISQHAEHTADRAQASQDKQPHLSPQEQERRSEEHARQTGQTGAQAPADEEEQSSK